MEEGRAVIDLTRLMSSPAWKNSTPAYKSVLLTLLEQAHHEDTSRWNPSEGENEEVPFGTVITSLSGLASDAEVSRGAVRAALKRLGAQGTAQFEARNQYHVICLQNTSYYISQEDSSDQRCTVRCTHGDTRDDMRCDPPSEVKPEVAKDASLENEGREERADESGELPFETDASEVFNSPGGDPLAYMKQNDGTDNNETDIVGEAVECYREVWEQPNYTHGYSVPNLIKDRYNEHRSRMERPVLHVIREARRMYDDGDRFPSTGLNGLMKEAQFAQILDNSHTKGLGVDDDLVAEVIEHWKKVWGVTKISVDNTAQRQITARHNQYIDQSDTPVQDVIDEAYRLAQNGDDFWTHNSLRNLTSEKLFGHLFDAVQNGGEEGMTDEDLAKFLREGKQSVTEEAEEVF